MISFSIITKFHFIFEFIVILSIIDKCCTSDEANDNKDESKEIKTTQIDLDSLPELFSNEKLPNSGQKTNRCFELLGCFESIPVSREPQEPDKLKFSVKIYRRNTQNDSKLILFDRHKICLRNNPEECQIYPYDLNLLLNSTFNPRSRTIVITPGYRSRYETDWQIDFKDRWLKLENVNVITVGWDGGSQGIYETSVSNTKLVARQITVLLYYLASLNGLSLNDESFTERIVLIGHSLGAHISGFVGKDLSGLIGRISGLDPAGPEFNDIKEEFRLDKGDAKLVDAIHSNGCPLSVAKPCFGLEKPIAHLDYYANDGKHQPQCSFDAFGCSHGASIDYYRSFMDHEIYTRQYLDHKYHKCYRLFAIPGSDYEEFHHGTSLAKLCPITSLDDYDLYSKDVNKCTIPIDFVSWYDKFRQELIDNYNINFNSSISSSGSGSIETSNRKYFFYTSPAFPYINNHNFIKIRVSKLDFSGSSPQPEANKATTSSNSKVCDLILHVKMASGAWMKNEVNSYELLDRTDHYEVILPYISTDSASKYELAKLDANDFYVSHENETNYLKLQTGIKAAFPKSIELIGIQIQKEGKKKKKGILDAIKNFFGLTKNKNNKDDDAQVDKNKLHECSLNIETITIQPLKKIHRHFVASYSMKAYDKEEPDLVILEENQVSPKIDLLHGKEAKDANNADDMKEINSEIYIDTVIIGPRDNTIDVDEEENNEDEVEDNSSDNSENNEPKTAGSGVVWLVLMISLVGIIIIVMGIGFLYVKRIRDRRTVAQDKQLFIYEEQMPSVY